MMRQQTVFHLNCRRRRWLGLVEPRTFFDPQFSHMHLTAKADSISGLRHTDVYIV
jgi:hypothetical protein